MNHVDSGGPGLKPYRNPALNNTKDTVKSSPGRLFGWHIQNPNASSAYLQLYDAASASVVVGATVPTVTLWVPGSGGVDDPDFGPIEFLNALVVAGTSAVDGSGAALGSALLVNLFYR